MDPAAVVIPDRSGFVTVSPGISVHYELYLPAASSCPGHPSSSVSSSTPGDNSYGQSQSTSKAKLLMVMGAFATKAHFASTARFLADTGGYEVLIYDHRGVGMSGNPVLEQQTCLMLATDAVAVIDAIWGPDTALHVHGASMGGMVAQELALLLLPQQRLLSLGLAVTCRGLRPLYGLLSPFFVPQVLKAFLEVWYWDSRPEVLVRRVMRLVLSRSLLSMKHPSGETYEQVYFREWLSRFDHYWTFTDHAAGACHACICLQHYLPERKMALLRESGVPILCQVATQDLLIPAALQFELADKLRANTVTFPTGHMGLLPWKEHYHNMLLEHLAVGDALRGIRSAADTRVSNEPSLAVDSLQPAGGSCHGTSSEDGNSNINSSSRHSMISSNNSTSSTEELVPELQSTATLATCSNSSSSSSSFIDGFIFLEETTTAAAAAVIAGDAAATTNISSSPTGADAVADANAVDITINLASGTVPQSLKLPGGVAAAAAASGVFTAAATAAVDDIDDIAAASAAGDAAAACMYIAY